MILSENLLSTTQSFLTPDIVGRFSTVLGQPAEKIQSGLRSVIPTLLMGIVNKGNTTEGAEDLVKLVKEERFNLDDPDLVSGDERYLAKGSHALKSIFGNNLGSVVSKLGVTTGMNSQSITKLLGLAAPMVMSVLGTKIIQDRMNPSGLMGFLKQQKVNLSGYIPSSITNAFSAGGKTVTLQEMKKNVPWGWVLTAALLFFAVMLWLTGKENITGM